MKGLRIIINDFGYVEGGASSVALSHIKLFQDQGLDVLFISGCSITSENLSCEHISLKKFSKPRKHTASILGYIFNYRSKKLISSIIAEKVKKYDDIKIYLHSWTKFLSPSIFSALKVFEKGIDIVIYSHDYFLECPNGGYFNYKKSQKCLYRPLSANCIVSNCDKSNYLRKILRLIRNYIQKHFLKGLKFQLICVSEFQRERLNIITDIAISTKVIPNIFKINKPFDKNQLTNTCDFLYVGRFDKEKGILELLNALTLSKTSCYFCGDGPLYDTIKNHANTKLSESWLSQKDVYSLMSTSKGIIIPSLWNEADPLTSIESASLGVIRIVSIHCAASAGIQDGVNGYLIDPSNIFSFSKTLHKIKNSFENQISSEDVISSYDREYSYRKKVSKSYDW